jgi:hypothetical protein
MDGPRSGDGAPPQSPWLIHFKALQFLRDVMKPGKTSGNIEFTPICDADQQKSLDEEITNVRGSQEYEVDDSFSENATSEIQDPAPTANMRAPKREREGSRL